MQTLTLRKPDDWHLHLRDGQAMYSIVELSARCFARAIIMPNLKPPIINVDQALAYRQRILAALPPMSSFNPLMTLYLTDNTSPTDIARLKSFPEVIAVKYYPAGATTHSEAGVTSLKKVWPVLEAMQESGVPLLIHGEVTTPEVDIFDREAYFIEQVLDSLLKSFPQLPVVLEHITTKQAVEYVESSPFPLAATITAHHLLFNRNDLFRGGIRPHHYCLPILKRETHRQALLHAATSGNPRFFLGTDSAPHRKTAKEASCGCAGIFTAPAAIELYAEIFEQANALDKLENFASGYGADFYRLPRNEETITLEKKPWPMPLSFTFEESVVVPIRAGETIQWQCSSLTPSPD